MGKRKTAMGRSLNESRGGSAFPVPPRLGGFKIGSIELKGQPGPLTVQFPIKLTTQGKYDAATALCVVAKGLLEEADREVGTAETEPCPNPEPCDLHPRVLRDDASLTDTLRGVIDAVEAEDDNRNALAYATAQLGPHRSAALARISAFTIEDMQRCINVASNTRNRERWTASQWLMLYDGYKQSGWDFTPDEWTAEQLEDVLVRGLPPSWDADENPIVRDPS